MSGLGSRVLKLSLQLRLSSDLYVFFTGRTRLRIKLLYRYKPIQGFTWSLFRAERVCDTVLEGKVKYSNFLFRTGFVRFYHS